MGIIFGQYDGTKSPLMKWYAEYTYERTSNTNVHVIMTVVGEIKNHKSTSYMGTGNGATVVVTATVDGVSKTYTLKQANETWQGDVNNPRSCSFEFDVASSTSGVSIPISYSVAPGRWTTASEVPTQSSSFASPALLYTPSTPAISNFHLGTSVPITIDQKHAELTHNIYWTLGGRSGTVGTGIKNSVTFQTNVAWADQIPNATSGVGTIKCDTYAGDVLIGTRTIPFTAYVPDSVKPTCSVVVSLVNAYWGLAVKGYTKYKAEVAASGAYGSTISSYYISGGGYASSTPPYTSGVLNTVGDNKITVEVTDSRGRKGTAEATVKVYDYSPPSFSVAEAYRTDANKNKAKDGTYITTKATYSCSSVNGKNSVTCTVQYKKHLDASYTPAGSISSGGSVIFGNGALSLSAPYVVLLTLTDGIRNSSNPVTKEIPVGTMSRSFHIKKGGKGIGFGKIAETDNLVDSAWDIKAPTFQGNLQGDIYKAGAVLAPPNESNEIIGNRRAANDNLFNNPQGMANVRNALAFRWYDTYWRIGNIRGSSTNTYGFGFEVSEDRGSTYKGVARIGTDGTYYGNASSATKATQDGDGNNITSTYLSKNRSFGFDFSNLANIDNLKSNGWYRSSTAVGYNAGGHTIYYTMLKVDSWMDLTGRACARQTLFPDQHPRTQLVRWCINDAWSEWEWVNPPMKVGVEYRTTQYWNNEVIYAKLVDMGETPAAGSSKSINVAPSGSTIVRVYANGRSSDKLVCRPFPMFNNSGTMQATIRVTNQVDLTVTVHSWSFTSAYKVVAYVEYVKA